MTYDMHVKQSLVKAHISLVKKTYDIYENWAQFHNQVFTLSVNPNNSWPNCKWFAVYFLQIQLLLV